MSSNPLKQAAEAARSKTSNMSQQGTETMETMAAAKTDFLHTPIMRAALPFINGGTSGMVATTVIQPIDMIKVRLQLAGEGVATGPKPTPITVTREILAQVKSSTFIPVSLPAFYVKVSTRLLDWDVLTRS